MSEYLIKEDVDNILKEYASKAWNDDWKPTHETVRGDTFIEACLIIDDMPTADVQPVVHGQWIEQRHFPTDGYNYNVSYTTYMCSNCGLEIHNDEYSKYVRGIYTNCPICTARMDGDTNG